MGEQETQCGITEPKLYLVWCKELATSFEARRTDLHVEGELMAVAGGRTSKVEEARRRVVNVQMKAGANIGISSDDG